MESVVGGFLRALGLIPPLGRTTKGSSPQLPHDGDGRHAGPFDSRCRHGDSGWASQCNQRPFRAPANHGFLVRPAWGAQGAACETFDHFFEGLKELAANAELCATCLNARLFTRSMSGVWSEGLRKKLLALSLFPDLKTVLAICRAKVSAENTDADLASMSASVNAASRSPQLQSSRPQQQSGHAQKYNSCSQCRCCSWSPHNTLTDSQAYWTTCQPCGKQPHFAGICEARGRKKQRKSSSFRHHVQSVHGISPWERRWVNVTIATGTSPHSRTLGEFLATPDTGADVTIMGWVELNLLGFTSDQLEAPLEQEVFAANGQPLDCFGTFNLTFHLGSHSIADRVTVVDLVDGIFFGMVRCSRFGNSPDIYPTPLPLQRQSHAVTGEFCKVRQPGQQKEPSDPLPRRAFKVASADFFAHAGHTYLSLAHQLPSPAGWRSHGCPPPPPRSTIRTLAPWFCRLGIPTTLCTDGSPPYNSRDFRKFLDHWGITQVSSLPHYPQSILSSLLASTARHAHASQMVAYTGATADVTRNDRQSHTFEWGDGPTQHIVREG